MFNKIFGNVKLDHNNPGIELTKQKLQILSEIDSNFSKNFSETVFEKNRNDSSTLALNRTKIK